MEEYEIIWTSRAAGDLRKVYHFYTQITSEQKAFDLILLLLERVGCLSDKRFVKMGATDEEFNHLKKDYKKLSKVILKLHIG